MRGEPIGRLTSLHLQAVEGFSRIVGQADGRWHQPSPCTNWDAGQVVEHVIGFHDVLILRPLNAKPERPREGHAQRWLVTIPAIASVLRDASEDRRMEAPESKPIDLVRLLPMLTTDVLVHTWDLAAAIGVDPVLDLEACIVSYERVRCNKEHLMASGMFATPVPVADDVDIATKLIAFLGRDPAWVQGT